MASSGYTYMCKFDVLEEGVPRRFEVEGVPVSLVLAEKQVFAIHDVCSHSAVSLSEGEVDGCTVECWRAESAGVCASAHAEMGSRSKALFSLVRPHGRLRPVGDTLERLPAPASYPYSR
ncbi:Rieske 2Fe-2S domain-containing protein [Streptomyces sp. NPDC005374]|uniref:Rieske 2Fe-2S domain-containing protein n=1 Tax=Streptomyces sp. NPDC005374 TaxID=3364713 RepID=UPI0036B0CFAD